MIDQVCGGQPKVGRTMELNGLYKEGSGTDNQEVLETLGGWPWEWASEISRRVEARGDGDVLA